MASLRSICQGSFPLSPSLKDAEYQRHSFQCWSIFPNNVPVSIPHPPCSFLRSPVVLRMAVCPSNPLSQTLLEVGCVNSLSVRKLLSHFNFLSLSSDKTERERLTRGEAGLKQQSKKTHSQGWPSRRTEETWDRVPPGSHSISPGLEHSLFLTLSLFHTVR